MIREKRVTLFCGHYGSGKTNLAVNYAMELGKKGKKVLVADLDIINPYFRTKDSAEEFEKVGIELIASEYANSAIDVPSLPAELHRISQDKEYFAVLDVGGDDDGAVVLGGFNNYFNLYEYESYMVVNVKRPDTSSIEGIKELKEKYPLRYDETALSCPYIMEQIDKITEGKAIITTDVGQHQMWAAQFYHNTNLLEYTTVEMLEEGHKIIEKVSLELGIPIKYISGKKEILDKISDKIKTNKLNLSMQLKLPWQNREEEVNWQK